MQQQPSLSVRVATEIRVELVRQSRTGAELAEALGVSRSWISLRLSGKQEIGLNDLERIAGVLDVHFAQLIPVDVAAASAGTSAA